MTEEAKTKINTKYDWEVLIRKIRKIRGNYDRSFSPYYKGQPLALPLKEYLGNKKIIERGLMRWECIRRNAEFRRLYEADNSILRLGEDIHLTPDTTRDELSKEISKLKPKVSKSKIVSFPDKKHESKYTFFFIFFKDLGHAQFLDNSPVGSRQLHAIIYDLVDKKDIEKRFSRERIAEFIASIPRKVDFVVDFGYNKQEIMSDFEKQVDMWLRLNEAIGQRNDKRSLDYANIRRYLKIYDLRNSNPQPTFSELAERFYPGPSAKNLDSTIQQVKREYKRACELINGEFIYVK